MQTSPKHTKNITERVSLSKKLSYVHPPSFEIFSNPNLEIILPETQGQASGILIKKENTDSYINYI